MSWLWSDDLAALLVEDDGIGAESLADWRQRPQAYAVPEGVSPLDFARALLATEQEQDLLRRAS